ncbi:HAD hydrolase-like protein [Labrenzia sp. DG1229]|uniref:HAD hydrolase-like protein n=1 Tax=Labrenzia sp. DG1229 TaxID=681847 RepID=UPI00257022D3|nr:HAD hydrolase-like protein [Labrenzia sp. DG1229]
MSVADMAMIGDRTHDHIGANANGVAGIGVLSGDGSRTELEAENPVLIAKTSTDISAILKK